jgi:hypothetical protein
LANPPPTIIRHRHGYACASTTETDTIPVDFDKMALDHDGAPDIVIGTAGKTASATGTCD